ESMRRPSASARLASSTSGRTLRWSYEGTTYSFPSIGLSRSRGRPDSTVLTTALVWADEGGEADDGGGIEDGRCGDGGGSGGPGGRVRWAATARGAPSASAAGATEVSGVTDDDPPASRRPANPSGTAAGSPLTDRNSSIERNVRSSR